ncbi:prostate stem cell antigen isoform X2 [Cervus elaphus]|uniref:prostate stem cell antigen isoform X2 n=1 Tax=Cervus elaphus TaxID=9860 RepID=UPI001CC2BFA2|nr:prostate stem cell antigen isoform X2 [Cervus elaphus]
MAPCPRQALPSGNREKAREGAAQRVLRICPALGPGPPVVTVASCHHHHHAPPPPPAEPLKPPRLCSPTPTIMKAVLLPLLTANWALQPGTALQCYSCEDQGNNKGCQCVQNCRTIAGPSASKPSAS